MLVVLVVLVAVNWKCWLSKSSLVVWGLQLSSASNTSANSNVGGCLKAVAAAAMNAIVAAVPMVGSLRYILAIKELILDWVLSGEI